MWSPPPGSTMAVYANKKGWRAQQNNNFYKIIVRAMWGLSYAKCAKVKVLSLQKFC